MASNLKEVLDKLKAKGWPAYKIEKEIKIANGYLGKIASGYRIMTGDVEMKLTPFVKRELNEDFEYKSWDENADIEDEGLIAVKGAGEAEGYTFHFKPCEEFVNKETIDWGKAVLLYPDDRNNQLINAAIGRDESGVNEDEVRSKRNKANGGKKNTRPANDAQNENKDAAVAENASEVDSNEPIQMKGESCLDFRVRKIEYFENLNKKK